MGHNQLGIARQVPQSYTEDRKPVQDITHVSRNRGIHVGLFGDMTNKASSRLKNPVKTPYLAQSRPARTEYQRSILLVMKAWTRTTAASWEGERITTRN